jgi:heme/copper-type cytochrome/quinol oxidase subunit 2
LSVPSFSLLFQTDEYKDPWMIVNAHGNQWYWDYQIHTPGYSCSFDSYMVPTSDLLFPGDLRLLEVTNALYLPTNLPVRVLVSSNDVLHCWGIPSLGIKVDACPGRLNQVFLEIKRPGVFYGQCSEICGVNHGFMPIKVVAIPLS